MNTESSEIIDENEPKDTFDKASEVSNEQHDIVEFSQRSPRSLEGEEDEVKNKNLDTSIK